MIAIPKAKRWALSRIRFGLQREYHRYRRQLQMQNLLVSTVNPNDRRATIVASMAQSRHLFDEMTAAYRDWVQLIADFPRMRQRELFELLADLKASISERYMWGGGSGQQL